MEDSADLPQPATAEPSAMSEIALRALARWGGFVVQPRTVAESLSLGEGQRDGVWLGCLYVAGTSLYQLAESIATLAALRNMSGLVSVASVLGRGLLAPIITLVVAETILGKARARARGLALVPLVLLGSIVHMSRQFGWSLGLSDVAAAMAGGAIGVGLIAWVRPAISPVRGES